MYVFQQQSHLTRALVACRAIAACFILLIASTVFSLASEAENLCETQWKDYVKIASDFRDKTKRKHTDAYIFSTMDGNIFNCLDLKFSENYWEAARNFMQFQVSMIEEMSKGSPALQVNRDCGIWRREFPKHIQYEIYLPVDAQNSRKKVCLRIITDSFERLLTRINDHATLKLSRLQPN